MLPVSRYRGNSIFDEMDRWQRALNRLQDEMNRVFASTGLPERALWRKKNSLDGGMGGLAERRSFSGHWGAARGNILRADAVELEDAYHLLVDLPGLTRDELAVECVDGMLKISGERKREESLNKGTTFIEERSKGKFSRTFKLPRFVDESKIEVSFMYNLAPRQFCLYVK
eukprot:GHVU01004851.1.p1 GENE.GHVU01004851.1~~GHVU01004851.1.p1  ORF type:complete len:171 (+),score=15.46 GHVU01004851.1:58-570(+)